MAKIFSLFSALILLLVNLIAPLLPQCTTCDSTGYVICDNCDGEGFVYWDYLDAMIACEECDGNGEHYCPDCPEKVRDFYIYKTELEKSK